MAGKGTGKFDNGMMKCFLFFEYRLCTVCGCRIGPLGDVYMMPSWYRYERGFGPYQNELHCPSCHAKSEKENFGNCQHCKQKSSAPFDVQYYIDRVIEAYELNEITSAKFTDRWYPDYIKAGVILMESGGTPTREWAIEQPEIREQILD